MRFYFTSTVLLACSLASVLASPVPQTPTSGTPASDTLEKIRTILNSPAVQDALKVYQEVTDGMVCISLLPPNFCFSSIQYHLMSRVQHSLHSTYRILRIDLLLQLLIRLHIYTGKDYLWSSGRHRHRRFMPQKPTRDGQELSIN